MTAEREPPLPPYLYCRPERTAEAHAMYFDHFERHLSLPLAIRRDFYERGEASGLFYHVDFFAFYLVRKGSGVHWIDSQSYGLVKGDVYLMVPRAAHEFAEFVGLEYDAIFFQTSMFSQEELAALRDCPGFFKLFAGDLDIEHRIHLTPEDLRAVETHVDVMRKAWGEDGKAGPLILRHEFFRLLLKLARLFESSSHPQIAGEPGRKADSGLASTLRFCDENFDRPLSVAKLASRVFLSPGHFSELFVREAGMTPAAYIRRVRMEKARALLRDSDTPVAKIAARCGFANATQFSRSFRSVHHVSPLRYRKEYQQR